MKGNSCISYFRGDLGKTILTLQLKQARIFAVKGNFQQIFAVIGNYQWIFAVKGNSQLIDIRNDCLVADGDMNRSLKCFNE